MPDRKLTSIVSYPREASAEITVIVEIVPRSLLRI